MRYIRDKEALEQAFAESNYLQNFSFPAARYAQLVAVAPGEHIVQEGEEPAHLYYLLEGRAKLYCPLANGRVSLIDFFKAPCFIGEMELIRAQRFSQAVQALTACRCLALPVHKCREMLLQDPLFLRQLCIYLENKNTRNVAALSQGHAFPLANRLAAFLLLVAGDGYYREKHGQAADYLGVSYRHLLYALAGFVRDGLIEKTSEGYRLCDREGLLRLAREIDPQLRT